MVYQAPKPQYSRGEWFKWIILRVVFPPVLIWDALKWIGNQLLGRLIGSTVLQAQDSWPGIDFDTQGLDGALEAERFKINTHDGVALNSLEIYPTTGQPIAPYDRKYLVNFVGNGMSGTHIVDAMAADALELGCYVVAFDHRGVGKSTGRARSKDDLVTDGIAQVQRLLDDGVKPHNIILKGHSLGSGIATLIALHFHQLSKPIRIFNGRSFSSLTNVVVGFIRKGFEFEDHPRETLPWKILGWIAKPFVKFVLSLAKWEINAGAAFKAIPKVSREYVVVRTSREMLHYLADPKEPKDDMIITPFASLHADLKGERKQEKAEIERLIDKTSQLTTTSDPLAKAALENALVPLKKAKTEFSQRKMEKIRPEGVSSNQCFAKISLYSYGGAHNVAISTLENRHNKTASTFFHEFANRVPTDSGNRPFTLSREW